GASVAGDRYLAGDVLEDHVAVVARGDTEYDAGGVAVDLGAGEVDRWMSGSGERDLDSDRVAVNLAERKAVGKVVRETDAGGVLAERFDGDAGQIVAGLGRRGRSDGHV